MCVLLAIALAFPASAQTIAARTQAVTDTINNNKDLGEICAMDFYWEIGDRDAQRASGQKGTSFKATTDMQIYSAGKWLYSAYVFQKRGGQLTAADKDALRMQSGYNQSNACLGTATLAQCQNLMNTYTSSADINNQYYYAGGHFQKHATAVLGMGSKTKPQMVAEMQGTAASPLLNTPDGADTNVVFTLATPVMASGHKTTATNYAVFLRKMLSGTLLLSGSALGSDGVCTYPAPSNAQTGRMNCPGAIYSPAAPIQPGVYEVDGGTNEAWSYSIGHWVETDPVWLAGGGDAAYSSAGAAGFYPWIDSSRTYYGILARNILTTTSAGESVKCGRQIRKAWLTGIAAPSGVQ
ncbi:MAG: hypothetical protein AABY95_07070 [Pseudomonadota bacterium]